ncbi:CubicO group peptidase (beta-lactamase class C family) [Prosthecobacter fusiformis]|uniref:CubicO group peptidase (Beta-lactamase class C family) n=1 Tax=Prosthecobacter fusiformis TaxID=48464 RepID=A0A4R7RP74_9BACT|nr:serine hydrolase domain-containing protein [Prosthecobacter fusiformis]TDU66555.1 CubicO group peptidase (beta-lactamase class C family) [Prosthecobacter fusiformis]
MHLITPTAKAAITEWFEENFRTRGELGASVSVWQHGVEVLSLSQGSCDRQCTRPWDAETLVPVFSSTKAPAAVCCLMALEEAELPLDCAVSEVWPEFVGGGKGAMQFAHLFSHTAGLCALDERVPIFNYEAVIEALENQTPLWEPGTRQGYHARTFGFLMDEIVRRITGVDSLGEYFRECFGSPMGLDFWIGLPSAQWDRVSPVYPGKISIANSDQPFLKAYNTAGSLTQRTFSSPFGLTAVSEYNNSGLWAPGFASMGGVGSARGLGKFYAMLANGGQWNGNSLVSESIIRQLSHTLSQEDDSVLLSPIAFAAGVMQDPLNPDPESDGGKLRQHYGRSLTAFGHPGAGGSLSMADPENGIALSYAMNQMEVGALPGAKALGMVERLYW